MYNQALLSTHPQEVYVVCSTACGVNLTNWSNLQKPLNSLLYSIVWDLKLSPPHALLHPIPSPSTTKPGYRSSCCTKPPGLSWPVWGKQGWGWGWLACRPAGPPIPLARWCSWRKSACVCGWCNSPPAGWASSSARFGTLTLCTVWRYGTHWGKKKKKG